jgi:phosphoglycolate phosphatase-like HAD superfamily hydrolase
VKNLLIEKNYKQNETILIGDSINDYEVSKINNIDFYGYNNLELENISKTYIINFSNLYFFDYGIGEASRSFMI